jgi:hypothetical protein
MARRLLLTGDGKNGHGFRFALELHGRISDKGKVGGGALYPLTNHNLTQFRLAH